MKKTKRKDPAAAALGRKRWKGIPKDERSAALTAVITSRWEHATPEQRAATGKRLTAARAKKKAGKK